MDFKKFEVYALEKAEDTILFCVLNRHNHPEDEDCYELISLCLEEPKKLRTEFWRPNILQNDLSIVRVATDKEKELFNSERDAWNYSGAKTKTNKQWLEKEAYKIVKRYWNLNEIPNIALDSPKELPEYHWRAAYFPKTKTIAFRSDVLCLKTKEEIIKVLIHELCHWYLHVLGEKKTAIFK
ncbi:SprT-like domain-containing protein [Bacillus subtilis]|uniref:SprT-like domain-containing protein n=1 Tax=Bacillus subtilis TaxID=1423 RepID=UPI0027DED957|nr:SprT-like domain-containing protein [Bacillus subtilis]MDQ4711679.1 SprT-like domain-containing protein [Bacillus subtilis]